MIYKPEFRDRITSQRKNLAPIVIRQASQQVAIQVVQLKIFNQSQHIGYYCPQAGEIDPQPIILAEHQTTKKFYLPKITSSGTLEFYQHDKGEPLSTNKYGILEPTATQKTPFAIEQLDLVLVPLVAFDKRGNRIGQGAGYYDKTFAFRLQHPEIKKPFLLGLAYEFQQIDVYGPKPWDVPLDCIVTELHIYHR